jgi:hypothetical protein
VPDCAIFAADVLPPAILFSKMRRKNEVMSKNAFNRADPARMALEEMESYCATHPNSPSAARRPALSIRRGLWIALLGPSVETGIVGIGFTVEGALRAFDSQYMAGSRFAE